MRYGVLPSAIVAEKGAQSKAGGQDAASARRAGRSPAPTRGTGIHRLTHGLLLPALSWCIGARSGLARRVHYGVFAFDPIVQASPRTVFSAPSLVRLLARVSAADPYESGLPLFEQLSEWLSWTDAIALSNALDGALPAVCDEDAPPDAGQDEAQFSAQVRASLAKAVAEDGVFARTGRPAATRADVPPVTAPDALEYGPVRQQLLATQQLMETRIADLRERLRGALALRSAPMARLAALDATMEHALAERERALLASVPALLEGHFKRLQQAARDTDAPDAGNPARAQDAWLDVFRKDMHSAMLAELAIRFQPIEGLLAALRIR